jgi:hypothetical protein
LNDHAIARLFRGIAKKLRFRRAREELGAARACAADTWAQHMRSTWAHMASGDTIAAEHNRLHANCALREIFALDREINELNRQMRR